MVQRHLRLKRLCVPCVVIACACGVPSSEENTAPASVSEASPHDTAWERVASIPEARSFHQAALGRDGRIYVFAGRHGPELTKRYTPEGRHAVVAYDPAQDAWSEVPAAPKRETISFIQGMTVPGTPESELIVEYPPGAADGRGRVHWFGAKGPVVFDPEEGAWHQGKQPTRHGPGPNWEGPVAEYARKNGATATGPDGRIYLVGGRGHLLGESVTKSRVLSSLEIYDPEAESWETRAPMAEARQLFAAAFGPDGKLYAFGGYGGKGSSSQREGESDAAYARRYAEQERLAKQALRSVEAYDPATDIWSPRTPLPAGRQNLAAVRGPDGRIYVIGGSPSYMDPAPRPQVFVYDSAEDSWSEGPPLLEARFNHAAAVDAEGRIYAIGGIGGREREEWTDALREEPRYEQRALRSVERLDLGEGENGAEAGGE